MKHIPCSHQLTNFNHPTYIFTNILNPSNFQLFVYKMQALFQFNLTGLQFDSFQIGGVIVSSQILLIQMKDFKPSRL
jgi:hypothetical protein